MMKNPTFATNTEIDLPMQNSRAFVNVPMQNSGLRYTLV